MTDKRNDWAGTTLPDTPPGGTPTVPTPDQRYTMRRLLGRGGMGEVWLAHDARIDREVAIKLMRDGTGNADRFLREARVQGRLEHPSIVPVHDLRGDAAPYFVMKRLAGITLGEAIRRNAEPWTRRTLLTRFVDVCLAIELAHQHGVIHRDLKPENIMLGDFGETYVLDWGLARVADAPAHEPSTSLQSLDLRGTETVAGTVLGTPGYMAPEQMCGEVVDHRADIYSLGCVLFEIVTGTPAVPRARARQLQTESHSPSTTHPDVAPELDELCVRATATDPAARFASARDLANGVQRFLDGDRDLARRIELAAEHASRARTLLESAGDNARSEAMREAGRALALDASNTTAQQVLSRLLIEPPRQIPAGAQEKIERERRLAMHAVARVSVVSYPLFLAVLATVVAFGGVRLSSPIIAVFAILVVLTSLGVRFANPQREIPSWLVPVAGTLHVALVAVVGMIFGTLLLLPMMTFGSLPAFLLLPARRMPPLVMAVLALGLAVPLALEVTGIAPRSYKIVGDAIVFRPWAITIEPTTLIGGVLAVVAVQLVANYMILGRLRRAQDRAQEQLHVQSWQLEQLVETPTEK